jgi:hypothetical protein
MTSRSRLLAPERDVARHLVTIHVGHDRQPDAAPPHALFNSQLLDPIPKRTERHPQYLGGGCLIVSGLLQRLEYGVALDFL